MAAFNSSRSALRRARAALSCDSYSRYAFFPRDMDATMVASPAAMAAAAAAALPPPGVAGGGGPRAWKWSDPGSPSPTGLVAFQKRAQRAFHRSRQYKSITLTEPPAPAPE